MQHGRRIIAYQMWDADKYPYKTIMEMFYVLCMMLSREVKTQIAGITLVGDMAGMSRKHVPSTWSDVQSWATFMKVRIGHTSKRVLPWQYLDLGREKRSKRLLDLAQSKMGCVEKVGAECTVGLQRFVGNRSSLLRRNGGNEGRAVKSLMVTSLSVLSKRFWVVWVYCKEPSFHHSHLT